MWKNIVYAFIAIIVYISRNIHSHRQPTDFNAESKELLAKYGQAQVQDLLIVRRPVHGIIDQALRTISFGFYDRALASLGIRSLDHISLMVSLDISGYRRQYISIEKNHTARLIETRFSPAVEYYICEWPKDRRETLEGLVDTIRAGDEDLFRYDMFDNNCQTFVVKALDSLNVQCPALPALIQDVSCFYSQMPAYVAAVSKCFLEVRHSIKNYLDTFSGRSNTE
jgi:hypothetical protein